PVGHVARQQRPDDAVAGLCPAGARLPGAVANDEEPVIMALLICALCLFIAASLFGLQVIRQWRARVLVTRRLQGRLTRDERLGDWLQWLGNSVWGQRLQKFDGESQALLERIGWRRS